MFACPTSSIRSLMFTVLIVMFTCLVQPPCVVAQGSVIYHLPTFFDANRTDCDTLHRRAVVALVGHDYARAKLLLVAGELPLRVASGNGEKVGGCLYTLGLCLKFEGNYAKAAEIFVAARRLNPDDLAIYNALGQCYAELGDYAQAIRYFRLRMRKATLQHLPQKCAEACIDLSATLNKTPKADAAAAVARFGIAQTNDAATKAALQLNLGNACLYLARYDEALAAYRRNVRLALLDKAQRVFVEVK